jgi:hypothetical protein
MRVVTTTRCRQARVYRAPVEVFQGVLVRRVRRGPLPCWQGLNGMQAWQALLAARLVSPRVRRPRRWRR